MPTFVLTACSGGSTSQVPAVFQPGGIIEVEAEAGEAADSCPFDGRNCLLVAWFPTKPASKNMPSWYDWIANACSKCKRFRGEDLFESDATLGELVCFERRRDSFENMSRRLNTVGGNVRIENRLQGRR
jgi:hypothetical protein